MSQKARFILSFTHERVLEQNYCKIAIKEGDNMRKKKLNSHLQPQRTRSLSTEMQLVQSEMIKKENDSSMNKNK